MRWYRSTRRCSVKRNLISLSVSTVVIVYVVFCLKIIFKAYPEEEYVQMPIDLSTLVHNEPDTRSGELKFEGESTTHCREIKLPNSKRDVIYRNKYWQVVTSNTSEEIVVYSAFYDNRKIIGEIPVLRTHGIVRLNRSSTESKVFCQVWYEGSMNPKLTEAELRITGRDYDVVHDKEKRIYGQRLYTCNLSNKDEPFPTHVSLTIGNPCTSATNLLSVRRASPAATWKHEFAVCVESSLGCYQPERLVEWFEAYRMFGVTRFNIYNGSICSGLDPIFKYYSQLGVDTSQKIGKSLLQINGLDKSETNKVVSSLDSRTDKGINDDLENEDAILSFRQLPPVVNDYSEEGIKLSSPVSLNDCYLRHMHTTRFVVIVDYDEIIVPRLHENYKDMLRHIDKTLNMNESYHTYAFRNTFFFEDLPLDASQPIHLRTLRYRHHVPPSNPYDGCKSFIDPVRCLSVFNHYCWLRFPNSPKEPAAVDVDTNIARSHHYQYKCPYKQQTCDLLIKQEKIDDTMIKFKEQLRQRVNKVLTEINIAL